MLPPRAMHQKEFGNTPEYRPAPLADLVALAVYEKNRSAFAVLYERYQMMLVNHLQYLVNNRDTAYDIVNDTFERVWERIQQESVPQETIDHFEAWLAKIAINRAIDYRRRSKKFEFLSLPESETNDPKEYALSLHPHLSEAGFEEQRCDLLCLEQAVAAMSPQYQICYLLRVHWGYKHREIAEILGISEKTVSANIKRGFKQLHMIYTRMMGDHDTTKGERKRYGRINLQSL